MVVKAGERQARALLLRLACFPMHPYLSASRRYSQASYQQELLFFDNRYLGAPFTPAIQMVYGWILILRSSLAAAFALRRLVGAHRGLILATGMRRPIPEF
ncbi:MAG: hypothetical protein PVH18_05855 [Chloroflexota bacterium]|jgi:hypothetical protein